MPEKEITIASTTVSSEQEVKADHTSWSSDFSLKDKDIANKLDAFLDSSSLVSTFIDWLTNETKDAKTKTLNGALSTWYKDIFVINNADKTLTGGLQNWIEHIAKKDKDGVINNYLRFVFDGNIFTADIGTDLEKVGWEIKKIEATFRSFVEELVRTKIERKLEEKSLDKNIVSQIAIAPEQLNLDEVRKSVTALQTSPAPAISSSETTTQDKKEEKKPWFFGRLWNRIENVFTWKEDSEKAVVETKKEVGNGLKRLIGIWTSFAWVFGLSKYFDKKGKDAAETTKDSWKDMVTEIKWYFEKAKNWVDETFFDKKSEETASSTTAVVTAETEDLPSTESTSTSAPASTETPAETAETAEETST